MIVSDLDRTLLNSEGKLTEFTKRVLRDLRSHGTIIAIATARPPSAAKQMLEDLQIDAVDDVCESNDNDGVARWLLKTTLESASA